MPADLPRPSKRLLTRAEAAAHCTLSPAGFSRWVRDGRLPRPLPGTKRWDLRAIDRALDKLSGLPDADAAKSAYQRWKASHDARHAEGRS
jgi:predicted DNA-binding transcriptional regulator AlpA